MVCSSKEYYKKLNEHTIIVCHSYINKLKKANGEPKQNRNNMTKEGIYNIRSFI